MTYRATHDARLLRARRRWARRWLRANARDMRRFEHDSFRVSAHARRKSARFWSDYQALGLRAGDGWSGAIGGAAPVQGFGEVDGVPWYFRARGEHWRLEIGVGEGPDGELAGEAVFERGGEVGKAPYCASWIGARHAWSLIASAIAEFRREKREALAGAGA